VLGVADHLEQDVTTSINIANFVAAAKGFKYTFFQNLRFNPVGGVRRSFWATDHRARDGGDNSSARRDFVRINHAAVGEEGAVVAQVTAFVRVELPGGVENAFVIPNRVACPGVRRQTAIVAVVRWLAAHPLARGKDGEGRPMCSGLPANHALWDWHQCVRQPPLQHNAHARQQLEEEGIQWGDSKPFQTASYGVVCVSDIVEFVNMSRDPDTQGFMQTISVYGEDGYLQSLTAGTTPSTSCSEDSHDECIPNLTAI
jgi:hypothetical protein